MRSLVASMITVATVVAQPLRIGGGGGAGGGGGRGHQQNFNHQSKTMVFGGRTVFGDTFRIDVNKRSKNTGIQTRIVGGTQAASGRYPYFVHLEIVSATQLRKVQSDDVYDPVNLTLPHLFALR